MEEVTTPVQVKRAPTWRRFAIYFFAALGLIFSIWIAVLAFQSKQSSFLTFDADAAIEGVMSSNYGKYSDTQRGWLYVDEQSKLTYVVTVVQRKKVNGKEGEELYFITSGHAINSNSGDDAFYGVFQLRNNNGELYEYSDPRRPSGANAVKPENVHFERLSADVWGWVVKITDIETGDGEEITNTRNVVLAPHKNQIAVLAQFSAANKVIGSGGCQETERYYAEWRQAQAQKKAAPASENSNEESFDGEDYEPPRCTSLEWTYRTEPVVDSTFTPLHITRKPGMEEGVATPAKTWKVMFDPKSYTYLVPEELRNAGL
ncbi:hypothetical protein [Pseudoduganella sp.]|uniref:hypothetical protein n=1 Tax=Pseudoduganella sp. TaxID=1880898 RepID=UPI0035ADA22B